MKYLREIIFIAMNAVSVRDIYSEVVWDEIPLHKIFSRDLSRLRNLACNNKWKLV